MPPSCSPSGLHARSRCAKTGCSSSRTTTRTISSIPRASRSEEHTSELQSQSNLVCRLLLENKKRNSNSFNLPTTLHLPTTMLTANSNITPHNSPPGSSLCLVTSKTQTYTDIGHLSRQHKSL